jgi:hypothetical protein
MACKKSDLIAAVNSFGAARASGDINLITFAGNLIGSLIETLEFASEEDDTVEKTEEETAK